MKFLVLASGSKGNAAVVQVAGGAVLIDCGLNKSTLLERFEQVGFDPATLQAILITHEHADHIGGLGVCQRGFAKQGLQIPVYVTAKTQNTKKSVFNEVREQLTTFVVGETLKISGLLITSFLTSHDAAQPVGFRIVDTNAKPSFTAEQTGSISQANSTNLTTIGYITDTGELTPEAAEYLQQVDLLALECNHDTKMLQDGPYPYHLKHRVASSKGHLSNTQAAAALESLLWPGLHTVIGMHLSQANNERPLAKRALQELLDKNTHSAKVLMASQFMTTTVKMD